jgi:hypothetical protein
VTVSDNGTEGAGGVTVVPVPVPTPVPVVPVPVWVPVAVPVVGTPDAVTTPPVKPAGANGIEEPRDDELTEVGIDELGAAVLARGVRIPFPPPLLPLPHPARAATRSMVTMRVERCI